MTTPSARGGADAGGRARALPWSLHVTHGAASVRLCPAGPVDALRLLEREGLSGEHELEFVTRLEAGAPYAPYAVVRLSEDARGLPGLEAVRARLGVEALPAAAALLVRAWPEAPLPGERGIRRARVTGTPTARGLLRRIEVELPAPERIAWIEAAWPPAPRLLTHRYYVDHDGTPWVVRDRGQGGKTLHEGEVSPDAARRADVPRAQRPG